VAGAGGSVCCSVHPSVNDDPLHERTFFEAAAAIDAGCIWRSFQTYVLYLHCAGSSTAAARCTPSAAP